MRLIRVAIPISLLFFATACGGSTTTTTTPPAAAPTSASPSASASGGPSSSASGPSSSASGPILTGTLAPADGFKVFLKDDKGALVTTLPAGTYQVKISDTSTIHNLHLKGPGGDFKTTVPEKLEITWPVTLTAGDYEFLCDPHPQAMTQKFTVT